MFPARRYAAFFLDVEGNRSGVHSPR